MSGASYPQPQLDANAHAVTRAFVETVWNTPAGRQVHPSDFQAFIRTVDHRAKAVGTGNDSSIERIAGEITGLFGTAMNRWGDSLTDLAKLCGEFYLKIRDLLSTSPAPTTTQQHH